MIGIGKNGRDFVIGDAELDRTLERLGRRGRSIARAALNAGMTVIVREIKRHTPKRTGALRRSVGKQIRRIGPKSNARYVAVAGFNVGKKRGSNRYVKYGASFAVGTVARRTRSGANRGRLGEADVIGKATAASLPAAGTRAAQIARKKLGTEAARARSLSA
ncbi:MAG: HK97 gp10 family phage protein [Planctomycetota bacterium]